MSEEIMLSEGFDGVSKSSMHVIILSLGLNYELIFIGVEIDEVYILYSLPCSILWFDFKILFNLSFWNFDLDFCNSFSFLNFSNDWAFTFSKEKAI